MATGSLSLELRRATAALHSEIESRLDWPGKIRSLAAYRCCLERLYRFYAPIEAAWDGFAGWASVGLILPEIPHTARLAADLAALGVAPAELAWAPQECLPSLEDFPHALGAVYVIEGSTLGSQLLLRCFSDTLGTAIAGADSFFRGYGAGTGGRWRQVCTSLDRYGAEQEQERARVVAGARSTFCAIGDWMQFEHS
jgi:heme oxygenase